MPLSALASEGVEVAVRRAKGAHGRQAYPMNPEAPEDWSPDEAWSNEAIGE